MQVHTILGARSANDPLPIAVLFIISVILGIWSRVNLYNIISLLVYTQSGKVVHTQKVHYHKFWYSYSIINSS